MILPPAQMSFMSGSGTRKARKEFILAGPFRSEPAEYETLRPTRFEKKSAHIGKSGKDIVCTDREAMAQMLPVTLKGIQFDTVRTFHNLDGYPYAFEEDSDVLNWVCAMAGESPAARMLLKHAQDQDAQITLGDLGGNGYEIDENGGDIILDHCGFTAVALGRSAHFRNMLLLNFIKALRAIWHAQQNYRFEATHRPDAVLLLDRAQAADIETIAILVGWELRAAGHADIWRAILGSEEGDMAMIFTRAIEKDPAGFYDGSVLTRTFCQWYGDDARVAQTDADALEMMDDYLQHEGRFGGDSLKAAALERLSILPGMAPYLHGMGAHIATDPYFVATHDSINEAHLFQIAYDSKVTLVEGVPFRDSGLARKIFPMGLVAVKD